MMNNDFERYSDQLAAVLRDCDTKQLAAVSMVLSQLSCMISAVTTEKVVAEIAKQKTGR